MKGNIWDNGGEPFFCNPCVKSVPESIAERHVKTKAHRANQTKWLALKADLERN